MIVNDTPTRQLDFSSSKVNIEPKCLPRQFLICFFVDFWSILAPKMDPKSTPNLCNNLSIFQLLFWMPSGSMFGCFWPPNWARFEVRKAFKRPSQSQWAECLKWSPLSTETLIFEVPGFPRWSYKSIKIRLSFLFFLSILDHFGYQNGGK